MLDLLEATVWLFTLPLTNRISLGHRVRADKSGPLRRLTQTRSGAHAALPRRPGSFRDLSRARPRGEGHFDAEAVPAYVERACRRYLECGIRAHSPRAPSVSSIITIPSSHTGARARRVSCVIVTDAQ
jgi:hypothetical protein